MKSFDYQVEQSGTVTFLENGKKMSIDDVIKKLNSTLALRAMIADLVEKALPIKEINPIALKIFYERETHR